MYLLRHRLLHPQLDCSRRHRRHQWDFRSDTLCHHGIVDRVLVSREKNQESHREVESLASTEDIKKHGKYWPVWGCGSEVLVECRYVLCSII